MTQRNHDRLSARVSKPSAASLPDKRSQLIAASRRLSHRVDAMSFEPPVTHVYNPLQYAWKSHQAYLELCGAGPTKVLFLGMNPGPWGMAQTGVPFGQIEAVRDWLGIMEEVDRPQNQHPKRPIEGFACKRSEVSGQRLWGLFRDRFSTPADFFAQHFVANYCPLVFMEASGKNRTPDKLTALEMRTLQQACDENLTTLIELLRPQFLVGVGAYAEACFRRVLSSFEPGLQPAATVVRILHPSPASPAANRDWAALATSQLVAAGVWHAS